MFGGRSAKKLTAAQPAASASPAKSKNAAGLPPNASLLVKRLKVEQMEKLILQSIFDGTPVSMDHVTKALDPGHPDAEEGAEEVDNSSKSKPVLERMCTVTRAELDHDFAHFDKNGDGNISLDEFIKIMNHKNPDPFDDAELVALFQEMDVDGGGSVCYHEFAVQWARDRAVDEADAADTAA